MKNVQILSCEKVSSLSDFQLSRGQRSVTCKPKYMYLTKSPRTPAPQLPGRQRQLGAAERGTRNTFVFDDRPDISSGGGRCCTVILHVE